MQEVEKKNLFRDCAVCAFLKFKNGICTCRFACLNLENTNSLQLKPINTIDVDMNWMKTWGVSETLNILKMNKTTIFMCT